MKNAITYMYQHFLWLACLFGVLGHSANADTKYNGKILPFPEPPMAGITKPRLQDSTMKWPHKNNHLPDNAPNILIVLLDDVGFGISETFGGEIRTPTFDKLARQGLRYNTFHTTSICSPTRAALLTGRNHTRIGSGTIAERAVAWDGYTGLIPKSAATIGEILTHYGYHTSAFGKWHNTPAIETTSMGPKNHWPNGYGFEYFYGFLGGETSQYEPRLTENYNHIEPPHDDSTYHLTEDLVKKSLHWLDDYQAFSPDKPFFMYWAPGGVHGPHHVFKEWADRYEGKFDGGWDAYRERVHQRQIDMGIIPKDTQLTARDSTMEAWDSIPPEQRRFQTRLMEIFAGYVEHTDHQVGRLVQGLESRGLRENTLIFYIFGDNGSSSEGQRGSVSELLAQNNIPNTVEQQLAALERIGGIDALGTPKTDNIYHAGWAWAGSTPFKGTKLMGSYFGGTRNPMVVSWPAHIQPDQTVRSQFHHVIDIAPTIYQLLDITPPEVVMGEKQVPMDGISLAYTFKDATVQERKIQQFFDNNASRGIYHEGWFAGTPGPFIPWDTPGSVRRMQHWNSADDVWELYNLRQDFSQAKDLAQKHPGKLNEMKKRFLMLAEDNKDFPIGAGLWLRMHPEDRLKTNYTQWTFRQNSRRMPEFTAPGVGRVSNHVRIEVDTGKHASGVLYAVGGASGGMTVYMDEGYLVYEYNMMILEHYTARSGTPIAPGKHLIEVSTDISRPGGSGKVQIMVDGIEIAGTTLKQTVPGAFTATETFDVGIDLGSPVATDYDERRPFAFEGSIHTLRVELK